MINRELLLQALNALKDPLSKANSAIAALEQELAKPQNEFHPDWDTLQPYHERIAELEAQLALDKKSDNARELGLNYEPVAYWNGKDGFICADQIKYISIWSDYYPEPLYALPTVSSENSAKTVDHGFDRTASHMAGEYVDTKQQNLDTSGQCVHKSDKSIHEMPDFLTVAEELAYCAGWYKSIEVNRKEWVGLTDEEIESVVDLQTSDDAGYDIFCDGESVAREVMNRLKEKNNA